MTRYFLTAIFVALLWIIWCVLVVTQFVPALQRHITMWGWLMAYTLCMAPIVVLGFAVVVRTRRA